jgi:hypothetical protein
MKTLLFWTAAVEPSNHRGLIVSDVDESCPDLPKTFRGMSGGPVFTLDRELLGINTFEERGPVDGRLYATPCSAWEDVQYPFTPPADMPMDHQPQKLWAEITAKEKGAKNGPHASFVIFAEFFWSPSKPEHRYGEIGRAICVSAGRTSASRRYRMNVAEFVNARETAIFSNL